MPEEKIIGEVYFSARPIIADNTYELVYGYYVFCRGHHYILQAYNDNGFDERWETGDWIEIRPKTLCQFKK